MWKWQAIYSNNTCLNQFKGEKEVLFKEIEQDKLIEFKISKEDNFIIVNLTNGTFNLNNNTLEIPELSHSPEKYRLIYFRRNTVNIGVGVDIQTHTIEHFIGYQITINDKNKQAMISVKNDTFRLHIK